MSVYVRYLKRYLVYKATELFACIVKVENHETKVPNHFLFSLTNFKISVLLNDSCNFSLHLYLRPTFASN